MSLTDVKIAQIPVYTPSNKNMESDDLDNNESSDLDDVLQLQDVNYSWKNKRIFLGRKALSAH